MNMQDLTRLPDTDPAGLFRARDGLFGPELLGAAVIGLDFFTWIAKSPATAKSICESLELAERPADVMFTLFCAMGLLESRAGVFHTTQKAREFLVRDSPWYLGPYYASFGERPVCQSLLRTLRTGKGSLASGNMARKPWAEAMKDPAYAEVFTGIMDARGLYLGPILARKLDLRAHHRLLDVGGGSGIYACCIAAGHPDIKATVFEKPPVDQVTRECIARRGCAGRVDVVSGDMFAGPLAGGCDVHLWSNALHDWDAPTVKNLLGKSFAALPPGGMVVIHDGHINREKTGPLEVAEYSAFLMSSTEGKCYSVGEIEAILGELGFVEPGFQEIAVDHSIITARKPPA